MKNLIIAFLVLAITLTIGSFALPTPSLATTEAAQHRSAESKVMAIQTLTPDPKTDSPRVLRIGATIYPDVLDPQKIFYLGEIAVLQLAFEGLTRLDQEGNILPGAADRWEQSEDGKTLTFHIREGLERSDGTPIGCADFEYALQRQVDPLTLGKQYTSILYDIKGAREIDEYAYSADAAQLDPEKIEELYKEYGVSCLDPNTLKIEFANPVGFWEYVAYTWALYPTDRRSVEEDPDAWWTDPENYNGNGPFVIKELEEGRRIVFEANPLYWAGRPKLDRIEFIFSNDNRVLFEAYKKGELDMVGVSTDQLVEVQADTKLAGDLLRYPAAATGGIAFNLRREPFDDKLVRVAFSQAFDREGWSNDVNKGVTKPYTRWIPPGVPGASPNRVGVPESDPIAAVKTLAENGYAAPDSTEDHPKIDCSKLGPIKLTYAGSPSNHAQFTWLAGNFVRVFNCPITLDPVDPTAFTALTKDTATYPQFTRHGWNQDYPHPQNWLSVYWTCGGFAQRFGYCNPELDEMLKKADGTPNFEEAIRLYAEAEDLLLSDVPSAFAGYGENLFLVAPYVIGPREHPSSSDGAWAGQLGPILSYDIDLDQVPAAYPKE